MPIYVYKCSKCEKELEIVQKFSDEPLTKCEQENCDGELKKIIFSSPIQFKGGGWFSEGYTKK